MGGVGSPNEYRFGGDVQCALFRNLFSRPPPESPFRSSFSPESASMAEKKHLFAFIEAIRLATTCFFDFLHVKEPLVWEVRRGWGINNNFQWDHSASCLSFQSSPPRFFSTSTVAKPPFNSKREQQKWGRIIPRRPWRHQRGKG